MHLKDSGYIIRNGAGCYMILQPVMLFLPMHLTKGFPEILAEQMVEAYKLSTRTTQRIANFLILPGTTLFIPKVLLAINVILLKWMN